ncbi:MAG: homocitrate synthase [bacterium]
MAFVMTNCPECGYLFGVDTEIEVDIVHCPECEARLRLLGRHPLILQYEEDTSKFVFKTVVRDVRIIDTTLREGEQFSNAAFSTTERLKIVELLEAFGVDAIEVTTPISSERNFEDAKKICALGTKAKILAHTRCAKPDISRAVEAGVQGINVLFGASKYLQQYSHGKSIEEVKDIALEIIDWTRTQYPKLEVRFSAEDAFRSDINDLLVLYRALKNMVDRIGIPDTTGIATPMQVYRLTKFLSDKFKLPMEFHGHNDTGCAIANALSFLEGGGTYVNTTMLGIGERNGITSISGLISRVLPFLPSVAQKYDLTLLRVLDQTIADILGIDIPFTQPLTSKTAFTHKAGMHTKAVLQNPESYEIFDPNIFGMQRKIQYASSITGKHAVAQRLKDLGYADFSEKQVMEITKEMKNLSSDNKFSDEDFDRELKRLAEKV